MSPEQLEEAWTTGLRQGRRVTKQRLAVLHAVQDHPHSTADTIVQAVRERIPAITVQSVYVILADRPISTCCASLNRREPPPSTKPERATTTTPSAYVAARSKTWTVRSVPRRRLTPSNFHGMALFSADVLYRGVCAGCQTEAEAELAKSQMQAAASVQH